MRPIISSPRILRTGSPIGLEAIRQYCPAVFASEAHTSRGPRYRYVPTITPLEKMLANGWAVYEVAQQRSRERERNAYTKHMLRLRKVGDFNKPANVGDGVPEVVLINAHDGTAAYHLRGGFFRYICTNGIMVGSHISGFKVRHTIGPQTAEEVLEAGEKVVTESFPRMLEFIDQFRQKQLNGEEKMMLAMRALDLRYGTTLPKFPPEDLLKVNRPEDESDDLWTKLNVVQENILNGGWETKSVGFGRRSAVRPVERVSAVAHINAGLWDKAEELLA